ncbi:MAG: hypothetical protein AAFU73_21425 [Planctomycetota bacterium]
MKQLVILALVAVGGYLAYQNFPGLRTAAQNKLDEFQSWSEEDRKNDPVGFIEYAKGQLEKNIAKFQSAVGQVDENKTKNEATLADFLAKQQRGQEWIEEAKTVFRAMNEEGGGTWPIEFRGREYADETAFLNQVGVIRHETTAAGERAAEYERLVDAANQQRTTIQMRVADMRTAMDKLDAQKATIQQASLTDAADAVLADVGELVEGTTKMASSGDLLSLDELTQIEDKAKAIQEAADRKEFEQNDNRDFLLNG